MSDYNEQFTPYGNLKRVPDRDQFWVDDRLKYQNARRLRDNFPVLAIMSPEDHAKLGTYDYSKSKYIELRDLDLRGSLDDTVYKSVQIKGVSYQCNCKVFYYEKPGKRCEDYPKICPLGHPAYEDF
jgi:hypothetical protein